MSKEHQPDFIQQLSQEKIRSMQADQEDQTPCTLPFISESVADSILAEIKPEFSYFSGFMNEHTAPGYSQARAIALAEGEFLKNNAPNFYNAYKSWLLDGGTFGGEPHAINHATIGGLIVLKALRMEAGKNQYGTDTQEGLLSNLEMPPMLQSFGKLDPRIFPPHKDRQVLLNIIDLPRIPVYQVNLQRIIDELVPFTPDPQSMQEGAHVMYTVLETLKSDIFKPIKSNVV